MSFLTYGNKKDPETGSAFPKDFGSKAAMHRADDRNKALQQEVMADRMSRRMTRQAAKLYMKSDDPRIVAEGAQFVRDNSWALGVQKHSQVQGRAMSSLKAKENSYNADIKANVKDPEQRAALTRDRFGLTGADAAIEDERMERNRQAEQARQERWNRFQENARLVTEANVSREGKYSSEYGADRDVNPDIQPLPEETQGDDRYGYFSTQTTIKGPDGRLESIFRPHSSTKTGGPSGVDSYNRYTGNWSTFNDAYKSNPGRFGNLRRELMSASGRSSNKMYIADFAAEAVNVLERAEAWKDVLGLTIPDNPTSEDIIALDQAIEKARTETQNINP